MDQNVRASIEQMASLVYELPQKSKFRQNSSNVEMLVILVYDYDGVILTQYAPPRQTVDEQCYCIF